MLLSKKVSFVVVSLFLALLCVTWTHAVSETAKVEGYVYYADAITPMEGVKVFVYYASGKYATGKTDSNGYYSVEFTKNNKPIEVRYLGKRQIFFPELKELSGSTAHTISRTQEGETGKYSPSRVIALNNSAQGAVALMDAMSPEDRAATREYYRGLLSNVRVEQGTVTNEATRQFLQFTYDDTRNRYGLPAEELKDEKGSSLTLTQRLPLRDWPSTSQEPTSCMTGDVLKELLRRLCDEEPPSIQGLTRRDVQILRATINCRLRSTQPLHRDERPNIRRP